MFPNTKKDKTMTKRGRILKQITRLIGFESCKLIIILFICIRSLDNNRVIYKWQTIFRLSSDNADFLILAGAKIKYYCFIFYLMTLYICLLMYIIARAIKNNQQSYIFVYIFKLFIKVKKIKYRKIYFVYIRYKIN